MLTDKEFDNLLELARMDLPADEAKALKQDIDNILGYVETIQEVSANLDTDPTPGKVYNVLREDIDPYEPGMFKEDLLANAPETDENKDYIKVQKIL